MRVLWLCRWKLFALVTAACVWTFNRTTSIALSHAPDRRMQPVLGLLLLFLVVALVLRALEGLGRLLRKAQPWAVPWERRWSSWLALALILASSVEGFLSVPLFLWISFATALPLAMLALAVREARQELARRSAALPVAAPEGAT
jgi:hypothetical protein